jgi:hypothetical protein
MKLQYLSVDQIRCTSSGKTDMGRTVYCGLKCIYLYRIKIANIDGC